MQVHWQWSEKKVCPVCTLACGRHMRLREGRCINISRLYAWLFRARPALYERSACRRRVRIPCLTAHITANSIPVCPYCCNCLTIARAPGTRQHPQGLNAFTCRTCPYQFVLDHSYYERTRMKKKEKDDILGEEESDLPVNEGTIISILRMRLAR